MRLHGDEIQVCDHPILTAKEERELGRKIKKGGRDSAVARSRLVECNLRLVASIATVFRNRWIPVTDLFQEGSVGLVTAADRFNPELGYRFSTYATWWIRQAIGKAIRNYGRLVRIPQAALLAARKAEKMLEAGVADAAGVSGALGVKASWLEFAMKSASSPSVSLDTATSDGYSLRDRVAVVQEDEPALCGPELGKLLSLLTPKQRFVVTKRFGLDGLAPLGLQEVANQIGVTRERVRQLQAEALLLLRKIHSSDNGILHIGPRVMSE